VTATKGFVLYHNYAPKIAKLSDEERGRLLMALLVYSETGERPEITGREEMVFDFIADDVDRDAAKYQAVIQRNQRNAVDAGRKPKNPVDCDENPGESKQIQALPNEGNNKSKTKSKTKTKDNSPSGESPLPPEGDAPADGFETFWLAYPKKVGKGAAATAWKKAKVGKSLCAEIMEALEKQKRSAQWLNDNGRFIPNPATWINQARWGDEPQQGGIGDGRSAAQQDYGDFEADNGDDWDTV
jgi:hypothetical protein